MGFKSGVRNVATDTHREHHCGVPTMLDFKTNSSDTKSFRKALFELAQTRLLDGIQTITDLLSDLNDELELLATVYDVKEEHKSSSSSSSGRNSEMEQTLALLKSILRYAPRANVLFNEVLVPLIQKTASRGMEDLLRTSPLVSTCRISFLCQILVLFIRQYTFDSVNNSEDEDKDIDQPRSPPFTWSDRSETVHATLYELLEHEVTQLVMISCSTKSWGRTVQARLHDMITKQRGRRGGSMVSQDLLSTWLITGHIEQIDTLSFIYDYADNNVNHGECEPNDMQESQFREVCYDVLISMDQWCPLHGIKIKMTMAASLRDWYQVLQNQQYLNNDVSIFEIETDLCSSSTASASSSLYSEERIAPIPLAAREAMGKVTYSVLPRNEVVSRVLWRILPAFRYSSGGDLVKKRSDDSVSTLNTTMSFERSLSPPERESRQQSRFNVDMCHQNKCHVVAIAPSICSSKGSSALEASIGKTTIASLIVHRQDIRKHFKDGVVWLSFENQPGFLTHKRYRRLLEEILRQLQVAADSGSESSSNRSNEGGDWPEFPEMIPWMDGSGQFLTSGIQQHVEDGYKTHSFNQMARFLCNKRVLLILDNVDDNETLRWFNFAALQSSKCQPDHQRAFSVLVTTRNRRLLRAADTVEVDALGADEVFELLHGITGSAEQPNPDSETIHAIDVVGLKNPVLVSTLKRLIARGRSEHNERVSFSRQILGCLETRLQQASDPRLTPTQVLDQCIEIETETQAALPFCIRICLAAFEAVFGCHDNTSEPVSLPGEHLELCSISIPVSVVDCLFGAVLRQSSDPKLKQIDPGLAATVRLHLLRLGFLQKVKVADVGRSGGWCVKIPHSIYKEYALSILAENCCDRDVLQLWNAGLANGLLRSLFACMDDTDESKLDSSAEDTIAWGWGAAPEDHMPIFQYSLKRLPEHMIRGGLYLKACQLLGSISFIHERLFQLGPESSSERLVREISWLLDSAPAELFNRQEATEISIILGSHLADLLQGSLAIEGSEVECQQAKTTAEKSGYLQIGRGFLELGTSLCNMGIWKEAMPFLQSSLDAFGFSLGETSETTAALSYNLGLAHSQVHMYEDAIYYYTECMKMRRKLYGEKHSLVAMTLAALGSAFVAIGEYSDAKKSYALALDMLRHKPRLFRDKIGDTQERLGDLYFKLSEWEMARQCYQSALLYKQAEFGEDCPTIATVYQQLGMCEMHLGNPVLAIDNLDHAIALWENLQGRSGGDDKDEWKQIQLLVTKGARFDILDERKESLDCYSRAIDLLHTRIWGIKRKQAPAPVAEKMLLASILHSIGSIHQRSSDDNAALKSFGDSLAAYCIEEAGTEMPCYVLEAAHTLTCMAQPLQNLGRTDEALSKLEKALHIRQKHIPDSALVAETHEKVAAFARAEGDTTAAQASLKDALEIRRRLSNFDESHSSVVAVKKELSDLIEEIW